MMGVCLKLPDLQLTYSQFSWNVMAAVGKAQGLGGGNKKESQTTRTMLYQQQWFFT